MKSLEEQKLSASKMTREDDSGKSPLDLSDFKLQKTKTVFERLLDFVVRCLKIRVMAMAVFEPVQYSYVCHSKLHVRICA